MLGDLNKLKVVELKAELASRGLDTKGVKAVLVDRLKAALDEEGGGASIGNATSDSEDHKPSQDSSEESEVVATPSRRGRRTTSTREDSPPPESTEHGESVGQSIPEESEQPESAESEEQDLSTVSTAEQTPLPSAEQEAQVFAEQEPQNTAEQVPQNAFEQISQHTPVEVRQYQAEQEEPQYPTEQVPQYDESSESKDSSEQQEASSPEEPAAEESQSSNAMNQEDSEPFASESAGDSQSCIPVDQDMSESVPSEVGDVFQAENSSEPIASQQGDNAVDMKVEPSDNEVKVEDVPADSLGEVKDESNQLEASKRVRRSRFTDNEDAQGATEIKEEPTNYDDIAAEMASEMDTTQVKSEPSNDRKRHRSPSRSPRRRSRSPHVKEEDEPVFDESAVLLSWYDSDLNLTIEKSDLLTATPMHQQGFGYVWAGARASFGFSKGKICYEVKCLEECNVSHIKDEVNPHVLRVGWSVQGTSMQLGEEKLSYGYGGTGKGSVNCQFKDYGKVFGVGDTITAYLDMDSEPKILSYAVNGEPQGVAYEVSSDSLEDKALFPHILTKNLKFSVRFSGEPAFPLLEGFTFCGEVPVEDRVAGPQRPEKKEDCEMIMMCGLPGCGKTFWANKYTAENPDKLYNILGTNNLIDKMKVMGLPRKRNYAGRWDVLIEKCTKCLQKLLELAGRRRRNYILDQTNVYPSAVRRKMKSFEGFKRRAVVIVPADDEFQRRVAKREAEEGKDVPDSAVLEMKANFKLPEVGDIFQEVLYVELAEEEARPVVEKYRDEAKEKGFTAQPTHPSKRFKSERSGSSGDRRHDDRHNSRDGRSDYRDRRDNSRDFRDNKDFRDRGSGFRPRGAPGGDRNRSGWQPRGGPGGGWRDRNDGYRGGRGDSRGPWRSGGGRGGGGMGGGGYDRQRGGGGGYNQGRGGYGGRGGSKGWGYNQGSGGSSWGSWSQPSQQDYSQQWQRQNQTTGYGSSWKGYSQQQSQQQSQQGYGQPTGYSTQQGYSSYGNGSGSYNWNQQYYQNYGGWGQQTGSAATGTAATGTAAVTGTGSAVATTGTAASAAYDPYQQWSQFSNYGYSTSSGAAATGATSYTHGGK